MRDILRRALAWFCCVALLSPLAYARARTYTANTRKKRVVYWRTILVPPSPEDPPVLVHGACTVADGTLSAGDFFDGLEREQTRRGPRFWKHGRAVDSFPDHVDLWLQVYGGLPLPDGKCYESWPPRRSGLNVLCMTPMLAASSSDECGLAPVPPPYPDVLKWLRFQVTYAVNGTQMPQLETRRVGEVPPGYGLNGWWSSSWKYHFAIVTKEIGLADPLVFLLYKKKDGAKVAQLVVRL